MLFPKEILDLIQSTEKLVFIIAKGDMAEVVQQYTIRVRGLLDETWNERFNPMRIYHHGSDTLLCGSLPDHSALYGIIAKIQSLGLELLHLEQHAVIQCSESLTSSSIQERTNSQ